MKSKNMIKVISGKIAALNLDPDTYIYLIKTTTLSGLVGMKGFLFNCWGSTTESQLQGYQV